MRIKSLNSRRTQAELRVIRLSKTARYALEGMAFLAKGPEKAFCLVEDAARARKLPRNYLSKIFERLRRQGFLISRRGPGGGYALARPAPSIALSSVVQSLERPRPALRECLLEMRGCGGGRPCVIHEAVLKSERILWEELRKASLADIA